MGFISKYNEILWKNIEGIRRIFKKFYIISQNFHKKVAKLKKMLYNNNRIVVINMKKIYITIILIITLICLASVNKVYARNVEGLDPSGATDPSEITLPEKEKSSGSSSSGSSLSGILDPDEYDPSLDTSESTTQLENKASKIVAIIRNIGIILTVAVLMVIGIRNMFASVEEKSVIKQSLPGYIMGAFMVLAITVIPATIYDVVNSKSSVVWVCSNCGTPFDKNYADASRAAVAGRDLYCENCGSYYEPIESSKYGK